jgi:hypothetical protein
MCNDLHTIIERTVSFDVDVLVIPVCDSKYLVSIIAVFTGSVYFKLYAEISGTIAVEQRFGFVAVIVDTTALINFIVIAF